MIKCKSYVKTVADLWTKVIELSILKSPQYVLCLVSTDTKVETMERNEELLPHLKVHIIMENINEFLNEIQII